MNAVSPLISSDDTLCAAAIAQALLEGFNHHYALFRIASSAAKLNFEAGDVLAQRDGVRNRIAFYDARVLESVERLKQEFAAETLSDQAWLAVKQQYIALLFKHQQIELAETFFNSVCCRILHRTYFHNDFIFYRPAVSTEYIEETEATYRSYYVNNLGLAATLKQILLDFNWALSFVDLDQTLWQQSVELNEWKY